MSEHSAQPPYLFQKCAASGSVPLKQVTVPVPTEEYCGEAELPALAYTNGTRFGPVGFGASEVEASGYEFNSLSVLSDRMQSDMQDINAVLPPSSFAPISNTRAPEENPAHQVL
ncbi:hypothetical protein SISNIDRAFT_491512 [Sistotremastrum niveocremeum HHB9708]|nr:hypothetical protein SISNIDRAFT_491512 [Sistotremastrum niveocremeum HHB9708]